MPLVSLDDLLLLRASWRDNGLRVVLTNGVFDLLHAGHVGYLTRARALGDLLVVALNSDSSVRAIKGPLRPLTPEPDRAALLSSLRCVDYVVLFDTSTAESVVAALRPDIYVKGGDYADSSGAPDLDRLPEARIARAAGARVVLIPYAPGRSTSALIQLIVERYGSSGE